MNLLARRGERDTHLIGLVSTVLILSACTATTRLPTLPTDTSKIGTLATEMRPLSPSERAALGKALSRMLPNSDAAQFKWLPVAANGSGPIGYCGLVNVKIRSGEYVGFRRFFAMISKGSKGVYTKGQIEHIDGMPLNDKDTEGAGVEPGLTQANCAEWGYMDFNDAS
jgi:hypothetical protein